MLQIKGKKKKNRKPNRKKLLASVTGQYDKYDAAVDEAILQQMRNQGGLSPETEAQMEKIMKRLERRSWD
jgi:hypothetical protein